MEFARPSALVSGGAGGLGGATARRLVDLGMGVVVFEPDAERTEAFACDLGPRAIGVSGNHNDDAAVGRAIENARKLGTFCINVNAVGVAINTPPHGKCRRRSPRYGRVPRDDGTAPLCSVQRFAPGGSLIFRQ